MERKTFRILFLLRKIRTGKNGLAPILARITTNGLTPDPKDNISDEQLSEIAGEYMERMGCGGQPYIVFKYDDIDRRYMERSKDKIAKGNNREQIRHRVAEAMLDCPTENELRERHRAVGIDLYLRRNAAKRITGVTFIDHQNRRHIHRPSEPVCTQWLASR